MVRLVKDGHVDQQGKIGKGGVSNNGRLGWQGWLEKVV